MCIAIAKSVGKKLSKEIYQNCYSNNDDGAGFAYVKNGEVYIAKGFFSFEDFWEYYEPLEEQAGLIHFRVGTSGGMTGENCHPWRIADTKKGDAIDLAFIHNGVISISRPNQNLSDTGNFNQLILRELVANDPEFWKQSEFKWLIESAIGAGNKLAMMDGTGHIEIFNENSGKWEDDVWYSNSSYSYCRNSNYYNRNNFTHSSSNSWGDDNNSSESVSDADVVDSMDNAASTEEGEFAGIDVEAIDAKLESAEQARLARMH